MGWAAINKNPPNSCKDLLQLLNSKTIDKKKFKSLSWRSVVPLYGSFGKRVKILST